MKATKIIFLFLLLGLPALIFAMLKIFGKNEFDVQPLFSESVPEISGCMINHTLPYRVPDSVLTTLSSEKDSLMCIHFEPLSEEANVQLQRAVDQFKNDPVMITSSNASTNPDWKRCVFLLDGEQNLVLIDRKGLIRGQYIASDRDDMDRLLTEITILLKKY